MKKAHQGMMMSSLLFYRHFRNDLECIGFVVNLYDICVPDRKKYMNGVNINIVMKNTEEEKSINIWL